MPGSLIPDAQMAVKALSSAHCHVQPASSACARARPAMHSDLCTTQNHLCASWWATSIPAQARPPPRVQCRCTWRGRCSSAQRRWALRALRRRQFKSIGGIRLAAQFIAAVERRHPLGSEIVDQELVPDGTHDEPLRPSLRREPLHQPHPHTRVRQRPSCRVRYPNPLRMIFPSSPHAFQPGRPPFAGRGPIASALQL